MANYTEEANAFIEGLLKEGYVKGDIYTKFVKGGKEARTAARTSRGRSSRRRRANRDEGPRGIPGGLVPFPREVPQGDPARYHRIPGEAGVR